jgi:hypothetical protein
MLNRNKKTKRDDWNRDEDEEWRGACDTRTRTVAHARTQKHKKNALTPTHSLTPTHPPTHSLTHSLTRAPPTPRHHSQSATQRRPSGQCGRRRQQSARPAQFSRRCRRPDQTWRDCCPCRLHCRHHRHRHHYAQERRRRRWTCWPPAPAKRSARPSVRPRACGEVARRGRRRGRDRGHGRRRGRGHGRGHGRGRRDDRGPPGRLGDRCRGYGRDRGRGPVRRARDRGVRRDAHAVGCGYATGCGPGRTEQRKGESGSEGCARRKGKKVLWVARHGSVNKQDRQERRQLL